MLSKQPCIIDDLSQIRNQIISKENINTDDKSILLEITKKRRNKKIGQEDLASILDVSVNTIQNLENGRTSGRAIIRSIRLCHIFDCKHTELVTYIPEDRLEITRHLVEKKIDDFHGKPKILQAIRNELVRSRLSVQE